MPQEWTIRNDLYFRHERLRFYFFSIVFNILILWQYLIRENFVLDLTTPLLEVCKNTENFKESYEIVQILLKCGVSADRTDRCGTTAMMYACANGNIDIVDHFVKFVMIEMADNQGNTV